MRYFVVTLGLSIAWVGALTLCAGQARAQSAPAPTTEYPPAPVESARPMTPPQLQGTEAPPAAPPAYPPVQPQQPYYYPVPPQYPGQSYPQAQPPPGYPPQRAPAAPSEWRPSQPGVVITIDRVFGVFSANGTRDAGVPDVSETTVNFLGGSPTSSLNPFAVPLVTLSGIVGPGVTIGGGIGYESDVRKDGTGPGSKLEMNSLAVAPRFGGIIDLGSAASLWLRGGITYSSQKYVNTFVCSVSGTGANETCTQTTKTSSLDFSLDPVFILTPIPHLGILVGPIADVALSGKETLEVPTSFPTDPNAPATSESDFRLSSFGVAAGVALFL